MQCKFCAKDCDGSYCSLEHKYEQEILDLKSENISLESRIRLLNCQRTQIWPDLDKTLEANILDTVNGFHSYVHEMTPDEICCLQKKTEALSAACLLVITKQKLKSTQTVETNKKVKASQEQAENLKTKSPLELAKLNFFRENKSKGFSESDCAKMWSKARTREQAIDSFMRNFKISREKAEFMADAPPKGIQ